MKRNKKTVDVTVVEKNDDIILNEKIEEIFKEKDFTKDITQENTSDLVKNLSLDEERRSILNKYSHMDKKECELKEITDNIISKIDKFTIPSLTNSEDEFELSEEDMSDIIFKINTHFSEINTQFRKLVKEEEEVKKVPYIKTKQLKPKSIKIPRLTYKQIKAHCKEYNINIEEWIEKITLNEINRIIIRLGDIDYKELKKKNKREKQK